MKMDNILLLIALLGGSIAIFSGARVVVSKNDTMTAEIQNEPLRVTVTGDDANISAMALTMYGEARGESLDGLTAVGHVILNRVKSPRWPNSVQGVVKQPKQFSCWNKNDPNYKVITNPNVFTNARYKQIEQLARDIYYGRIADPTNGADHYHTHSVSPYWSKGAAVVASIGNHKFFKLG